jgi:transposase
MDNAAIRKIKPYLEKKIVKGYAYYQLVRKARIDGKVKRVWSKHLGTAAAIERVYDERDNLITNLNIKSFEYGRTAALINISEELNFVDTINKHITKKEVDGLTVGEYLRLIILGRSCGPLSKNKTADWFHNSFLNIILSFPHELNTNNFVNQMDYLTDVVMEKIQDDIGKRLIELGVKPSTIFFDTTNFFTYIESGEDLPSKGKSKERRYDKNLIGLGMITSDANVPILAESYAGKTNDAKIFKVIFNKIVERLVAIEVPCEDIVLVIDRGCNSTDNIELVLSKMHIVGAAKTNQVRDMHEIPLNWYEFLYKSRKHDVLGYRTKKELFGTEFTVVISYNEGSYKKQSTTYETKKIKIIERLFSIKQSVERKGRGRKKSMKNALIDASKAIPDDYKTVFLFEDDGGVFKYSVDPKAEKELYRTFGKNVIITDMHDWSSEKIVKTYTAKDFIEKDFKWLKNVMLIPVKPIFHRKDCRIKVHIFLCVMGLVFYRYLLWKLKKSSEQLSDTEVIEKLENIRIALVKSENRETKFVFETMDVDQMRLFSMLRLGDVLEEANL